MIPKLSLGSLPQRSMKNKTPVALNWMHPKTMMKNHEKNLSSFTKMVKFIQPFVFFLGVPVPGTLKLRVLLYFSTTNFSSVSGNPDMQT